MIVSYVDKNGFYSVVVRLFGKVSISVTLLHKVSTGRCYRYQRILEDLEGIILSQVRLRRGRTKGYFTLRSHTLMTRTVFFSI